MNRSKQDCLLDMKMEEKPIITSKLMGGVGNQMFQIALAYATAKKHNASLLFQKMQFDGCRQGRHPSTYYDNLFKKLTFVENLPIDEEISENGFVYSDIQDKVRSALQKKRKCIGLTGYWQSEHYFSDVSHEIKELFTPSEGIKAYLEKNTSVFTKFPELKEDHDFCFIGVRRGDYIKFAHVHNPCGMTYYNEGIRRMNKKRYYISSDDVAWCKEHFKGDQFVFFDIQDDLEQLLVSTLFKNYIISNSTYYWWGSFLSIYKDTSIIAPDKWVLGSDVTIDKYYTIYRDNMVVLERPVELA